MASVNDAGKENVPTLGKSSGRGLELKKVAWDALPRKPLGARNVNESASPRARGALTTVKDSAQQTPVSARRGRVARDLSRALEEDDDEQEAAPTRSEKHLGGAILSPQRLAMKSKLDEYV